MIDKKIKFLLDNNNISLTNIATRKNTSIQAISNKFRKQSFNVFDLLEYAELTGTRLAFIDDNNNPVISFDIEDIPAKEK
ncbi:hypothetical protein ACWG0P_13975 [Amedibacillus sp. YH-ame6]